MYPLHSDQLAGFQVQCSIHGTELPATNTVPQLLKIKANEQILHYKNEKKIKNEETTYNVAQWFAILPNNQGSTNSTATVGVPRYKPVACAGIALH